MHVYRDSPAGQAVQTQAQAQAQAQGSELGELSGLRIQELAEYEEDLSALIKILLKAATWPKATEIGRAHPGAQ